MATPTIALGPSVTPAVEDLLRGAGTPLELRRLPGTSEDDLLRSLGDSDGLIVGAREAVTARVIAGLGRCGVIARYGVGIDNVDVAAATQHGILVTCVPDASVEDVSEHAVALLLACARRIVPPNRSGQSSCRTATWPIRSGWPCGCASTARHARAPIRRT